MPYRLANPLHGQNVPKVVHRIVDRFKALSRTEPPQACSLGNNRPHKNLLWDFRQRDFRRR